MSNLKVTAIIKQIFDLQQELKELAPLFNWSGLGNLLGDYGEFMAQKMYNLSPVSTGTKDYDALTEEGKSVQIKTNRWASQIGFRGKSDLLLVLHVTDEASVEEIYYGKTEAVYTEARFSARDNKYMIAISKLKELQQATKQSNLRKYFQ